MHYCENGCDAEVNDAGYCPQCGHRNPGLGLEDDSDSDDDPCRICGAERCGEDCCWLCLACEIDTADHDEVYCRPCAADRDTGADEYHQAF
ncbi:hypothetical protein [Glycomyces paridis]|uniref:Uncharacterized protein n=1 Tax=Glycomyces paridis TaxID=2126555 RepID=A0A4S8PI54_9ACTN|nr:hypothetical protein [Glycomyces paridis]THV29641.1 hypothetical protein E9998_09160 [Glycomyces paridis]